MNFRPAFRRLVHKVASFGCWFALGGWVLSCATGCGSQPAQSNASDLARLKLKCGEDGLEFGRGGDLYTAHFNEQTRQCYLEQIAPFTKEKLVYAAEGHRMLAEIKEDKTGNTGIVMSDDGTASFSYESAKEKLKELMQEDLK